MLKRARSERAFSLVELILAVSILSIGLTFILRAFSVSAKTARFSHELTRAVFLGEDLFQQLEAQEMRGIFLGSRIEASGEKGSLRWSYVLSPHLSFASLYVWDLGIYWGVLSNERIFEARSYFKR